MPFRNNTNVIQATEERPTKSEMGVMGDQNDSREANRKADGRETFKLFEHAQKREQRRQKWKRCIYDREERTGILLTIL